MVIVACLLIVLMLALLAAFVFFANRLIEDSNTSLPGAVRWLLRTCGDYWWAPPAAWVVIGTGVTLLISPAIGIAMTAAVCLVLAGFCWWARQSLMASE